MGQSSHSNFAAPCRTERQTNGHQISADGNLQAISNPNAHLPVIPNPTRRSPRPSCILRPVHGTLRAPGRSLVNGNNDCLTTPECSSKKHASGLPRYMAPTIASNRRQQPPRAPAPQRSASRVNTAGVSIASPDSLHKHVSKNGLVSGTPALSKSRVGTPSPRSNATMMPSELSSRPAPATQSISRSPPPRYLEHPEHCGRSSAIYPSPSVPEGFQRSPPEYQEHPSEQEYELYPFPDLAWDSDECEAATVSLKSTFDPRPVSSRITVPKTPYGSNAWFTCTEAESHGRRFNFPQFGPNEWVPSSAEGLKEDTGLDSLSRDLLGGIFAALEGSPSATATALQAYLEY